MDVFGTHEQLIADYRAFTSGFVEARDSRIRAYIDQALDHDEQWPDPWLSLNPSFASGGSVSDLVCDGLQESECERISWVKAGPADGGRARPTLGTAANALAGSA